jgi:hypothetical protein
MLPHRFGRILLGKGALQVAGTLFELFAHWGLRIFKLS